MARSFVSTLNRMAREADRARRNQERAKERYARAAAQEARLQERTAAQTARQLDKLERQAYLEARQEEAQSENDLIALQIEELDGILGAALSTDLTVDFDALLKHVSDGDLNKDVSLRLTPVPPLDTLLPAPLGFFGRLMPGSQGRHRRLVEQAQASHQALLADLEAVKQRRATALADLQAETDRHNAEIIALRDAYRAGDAEAVVSYFEAVFQRSEYPDGFPQEHSIAFAPESKQLVVDYEIPAIDEVVPTVEKYRYVRSNDEIVETKRSEKTRQALYVQTLAQTALRLLHEVFDSDEAQVVENAVVSVFVSTIDRATGRPIRPCLISVRVSAEQFGQLNLDRVEPATCLKQLRAHVSGHPSELVAVKPIVDINMVDHRFIQEADVLSTLDSRPNLMELTPSEFESLITNLFERMGLEARLTQASRDGGVDCVAFDQRPIFGGKVVIQAKRYKHTVGVSAVRDLYGTVMNEGASKGILVSTSGYGRAAFEFANGKPIELISGGNLLSLLAEHAGIEAKIQAPDGWVDAMPDV
ncbi:restriction endonuclease [Methylobacterium sp. J-048]|uniref:restriction endonuclease n=1 Tax=Methylobacterium sp. J-048 TaxID=2836635 RepID=UPI001FBAB2B4|nr:restriction endonuclease [Methylobacterium sp. J-048]MCJ2059817.1 restriction endonuclease [Methylobacterium sp. J-048]